MDTPLHLSRLWTDGTVLYPVEQCRTANTFGVAVMALTADRHLLLGRRSPQLAIAPGRWELTASGGCDPVAGASPATLRDYLAGEALRELYEEASLAAGVAADARVWAVVRDLRRGGLVDFFLAVHVDVAADDFQAGGEVASYVDVGVVDDVTRLAGMLAGICSDHDVAGNLSIAATLAAAAAAGEDTVPHGAGTLRWLTGER